MGQYYRATIKDIDSGDMKSFSTYDYGNGAKLMEHSYLGNDYVAAVLNYLKKHTCRLWWLGDYAEDDDFEGCDDEHTLSSADMRYAWSDDAVVLPHEGNWVWSYLPYIVVNLDKKCYIKLAEVGDFVICPLPLLTAVGNGNGGGDYFSDVGADLVGSWAGDTITVLTTYDGKIPEKYADFTDVTDEIIFKE